MADVIVQGTPLATAPKAEEKRFQIKKGRTLQKDGVTYRGGEFIALNTAAAHAFRDKLVSSEELAQAFDTVERAAQPLNPAANNPAASEPKP